MLSQPTLVSFAQYLALQAPEFLIALFDKHGLDAWELENVRKYGSDPTLELKRALAEAEESQIFALLEEIARTERDLKYRVKPKYRYDERWQDLKSYLELDNLVVLDGQVHRIEPDFDATPPLRDELHQELEQSELPRAAEVERLLDQAVGAFVAADPDYNAAMGDARVALQTLALDIAQVRLEIRAGSFDERKWGQVLAYLRTSELISPEEEQALAGVYGFLSEGAHRPVGMTERELTRLALSLATAMLYFLLKRFGGSR